MFIAGHYVKKRYLAGGFLVLCLLARCAVGHDEVEPQTQYVPIAPESLVAPAAQPQAYMQQSTPPIFINQQAPVQHDGFLYGLMAGHFMRDGSRDVHHYLNAPQLTPRTYSDERSPDFRNRALQTTVNKTTIVNNYAAPKSPAPAKSFSTPAQPKMTSSYTYQPLVSMAKKTWSTSSAKGWGSSTSYKTGRTSFSTRSARH